MPVGLALSTGDVVAAARADVAERRAALLEERLLDSRSQIDWRDEEIARLRGLLSAQLSELARMQERITELEARGRELPVEQLIAAFAAAVDRASTALEGQQVARLSADVKAALRIADDAVGLTAATPDSPSSEATSTVSFELLPRPRRSGDISAQDAVSLASALRRLQQALDRPLLASAREAAGAVLVEVTALLGEVPAPPTRGGLEPLVAALQPLGQALPALKSAVDEAVAAYQDLDDAPTRAQTEQFALALLDLARDLVASTARGWVHTVHEGGAWFNEIEGGERLPTAHRTKKAAVAAGRELARAKRTEHLIHKLDGTIGERNSYGRDPYPPAG
jgi:hypothetical protein